MLVSSTSLMSPMEQLKEFFSSFRVGCVSCARIQLHHHTIEIRIGYWSMQYLVEDPGCHLTLAH